MDNVTTEIRMNSAGRREFHIIADCTSPSYWDQSNIQELVEDFTTLKHQLSMDVMDLRVQSVSPRRTSTTATSSRARSMTTLQA